MRRAVVVFVALVVCAAFSFAEVAGNFQAGGLEAARELLFEWIPGYAIFDAAEREANVGDYQLFVEVDAAVGWFEIDRLSLVAELATVYNRRRDYGPIEDIEHELVLGLFLGAECYLTFFRRFAASLGLNAGAYRGSHLKDTIE